MPSHERRAEELFLINGYEGDIIIKCNVQYRIGPWTKKMDISGPIDSLGNKIVSILIS